MKLMSATTWQKSYKYIQILQNISSFYTTRSALATLDTSRIIRIKRIYAIGQGMVATLKIIKKLNKKIIKRYAQLQFL